MESPPDGSGPFRSPLKGWVDENRFGRMAATPEHGLDPEGLDPEGFDVGGRSDADDDDDDEELATLLGYNDEDDEDSEDGDEDGDGGGAADQAAPIPPQEGGPQPPPAALGAPGSTLGDKGPAGTTSRGEAGRVDFADSRKYSFCGPLQSLRA